MLPKFSALLEEIVKDYPKDLNQFLKYKLEISEKKAKELAERIERNFNLRINHEIQNKILEISITPEILPKKEQKFNIYSLDMLSGKEFEEFLKWFFKELGYQVRLTKLTADSGVDLVIFSNQEEIAVQAKRYKRTNKVPNSVILKTRGGQEIYGCSRSIVVTTSFFTQQAIKEAKKLKIELWDRNYLSARIDQINKEIIEPIKKSPFPAYVYPLSKSLFNLDKTGIFYIKQLKNERYHIHRHGIKHPLISFRTQCRKIKSVIFRIENNKPVTLKNGMHLIRSDTHYTYGPSEESAYNQIKNYLSQFIVSYDRETKENRKNLE